MISLPSSAWLYWGLGRAWYQIQQTLSQLLQTRSITIRSQPIVLRLFCSVVVVVGGVVVVDVVFVVVVVPNVDVVV